MKIIVWAALAAIVAVAVISFVVIRGASTEASVDDGGKLVREDSRVLSKAPDEQAVLVEFLDFECEACRSAYPFVEKLRADYGENVTFVNRYYPLPGHRNSMTAAVAVESAAQQGKYEEMYQRMYETQPEWGESSEDKSEVFRGFAEELGLDMSAYDAAVSDPATRERVEGDVADGEALGVEGTPTFFLNGDVLSPESQDEFRADIEAALAG